MIPNGAMIGNTYQIVREIGRGGTGVVYLAYHLNLQKYVVLKNTRLTGADLGFLRNEVDLLKELHHPGLPQVYDFLNLGDEVYTVIDFVDGTDLQQMMEQGVSFSEEMLADFMLALAQILVYLHEHTPPILHSDIKPGNIMLKQNGDLCLIDFNISVALTSSHSVYGLTRNYASPEQQRLVSDISCGVPSEVTLDGRSDIYSLGATFYYLTTGVEPEEQASDRIPVQSLAEGYSADFLRIIDKAMAPNREDRYQSARALVSALKRYMRRGADFRKRCLTQAALVFVCGSLFVGGLCTFIYGQSRQRLEQFEAKYTLLDESLRRGDTSESLDLGAEILHGYAGELEKNPKQYCSVELAMGDCYAESQELAEAAEHYANAFAIARSNDLSLLEDCFLKYAQILTERKDRAGLKALGAEINDDPQLKEYYPLMVAREYISENDLEQAETALNELLEQNPGRDTGAEAYCLLAEIADERQRYDAKVEFLELARQKRSTDEIIRSLADAYCELAMETTDDQRETLFAQAAELLTELCDRTEYPDFRDLVSAAECSRNAGMLSQAEEIVDTLLELYPNEFHSYAQAALLWEACGDREQARDFAEKALKLYDRDQEITSGLLERLQHLAS